MNNILLPWMLVIILGSVLGGLVTYLAFRSHGGSPLQALSAGGTAGAGAFAIGMAILNTVN
jgi:hypothetical protein